MELHSRDYPVLINHNLFEKNFGYYGSSAIFIRQIHDNILYPAQLENPILNELECGGYQISYNTFKENFLCPAYGEGVLQFECIGLD